MTRKNPLPLSEEWTDADTYVDALLSFATSSDLFRNLCGGVHILDFLTREPDLYTTLLPEDWRRFFEQHDIHDILHLLMREDIELLRHQISNNDGEEQKWKDGPLPPSSLLDYIHEIRRFSLRREFASPHLRKGTIPGRIAVGMKPKKSHEVENFSHYVDALCTSVAEQRGEAVSHVVDFGSGQNYLGRTLASSYDKHVIAIEREHQYISGANRMDALAKMAKKKKQVIIKNKNKKEKCEDCQEVTTVEEPPVETEESERVAEVNPEEPVNGTDEEVTVINVFRDMDLDPDELSLPPVRNDPKTEDDDEQPSKLKGALHYIEHEIQDGYLEPIIKHVVEPSTTEVQEETHDSSSPVTVETAGEKPSDARVMVVSLHSCGNLVHHGVRSLVLNPSVVAVAMIGCCYNLMTERLGPATYKLPILRSLHPRLRQTSTAYDPHGFPMSKRLEQFPHEAGTGMKLNITARSMAVQAPYNWGKEDSESFFTRHFYRTLLQRILLDKKIVPKPVMHHNFLDPAPAESESGGTPLIVGSLRKSAFTSFSAYVRASVTKLSRDPFYGDKIQAEMSDISDDELDRYLKEYWPTKKSLSVTWSLMAFSAAVVEAIIVVDRWQFLREHDSVQDCWVEPVFDYSLSPRNLAVIGIKK